MRFSHLWFGAIPLDMVVAVVFDPWLAAASRSRWPRSRFRGICLPTFCGSSRNCDRRPIRPWREASDCYVSEADQRERCVLITINSTISGTLWNVADRRGFNGAGGGWDRAPKRPNWPNFAVQSTFIWECWLECVRLGDLADRNHRIRYAEFTVH